MQFIEKLDTQEMSFAARNNLETHSFFSRIKRLNVKEVKPMPLMSCVSAALLGGLDAQLTYLQLNSMKLCRFSLASDLSTML